MTHDHRFHAGETVCLTEEFRRITGAHGEVTVEGRSKQSDGDGARYAVKAHRLHATVPKTAIQHA